MEHESHFGFEKSVYNSIYNEDDVPRPLKSRRDWIKIGFIQIDYAISDAAIKFRYGKLFAKLILDKEAYELFSEESKNIEISYGCVRQNLKNLIGVFSEPMESENFQDLKDKYVKDCEDFKSSVYQLITDCENLFLKFRIKSPKGDFSGDRKVVDEGIKDLTGKGLESLLD